MQKKLHRVHRGSPGPGKQKVELARLPAFLISRSRLGNQIHLDPGPLHTGPLTALPPGRFRQWNRRIPAGAPARWPFLDRMVSPSA